MKGYLWEQARNIEDVQDGRDDHEPPTRIGKYLSAHKLPRHESRKTDRWDVLSNGGDVLGTVQWFGAWRQYTFDPSLSTTFNRDCLIDLANFLRRVNDERRSGG